MEMTNVACVLFLPPAVRVVKHSPAPRYCLPLCLHILQDSRLLGEGVFSSHGRTGRRKQLLCAKSRGCMLYVHNPHAASEAVVPCVCVFVVVCLVSAKSKDCNLYGSLKPLGPWDLLFISGGILANVKSLIKQKPGGKTALPCFVRLCSSGEHPLTP